MALTNSSTVNEIIASLQDSLGVGVKPDFVDIVNFVELNNDNMRTRVITGLNKLGLSLQTTDTWAVILSTLDGV